MEPQTDATDRIAHAALEAILEQGVKKTSVDDVARRAGITRVTVYRHFGDKKGLVQAVCRLIASFFVEAERDCRCGAEQDVEACLDRVGRQLARLPGARLLVRLEEIGRLYPDLYDEFRRTRQAAIDGIFQWTLQVAAQQGVLRDDLNMAVVKALFWEAVVGLAENRTVIDSDVPPSEIFRTIAAVFRHGILKEGDAS